MNKIGRARKPRKSNVNRKDSRKDGQERSRVETREDVEDARGGEKNQKKLGERGVSRGLSVN